MSGKLTHREQYLIEVALEHYEREIRNWSATGPATESRTNLLEELKELRPKLMVTK